jgi:hypothetical protein
MDKKGMKFIEIVAKISAFGFMQIPAFAAKWAVGLPQYEAYTSFRALKN